MARTNNTAKQTTKKPAARAKTLSPADKRRNAKLEEARIADEKREKKRIANLNWRHRRRAEALEAEKTTTSKKKQPSSGGSDAVIKFAQPKTKRGSAPVESSAALDAQQIVTTLRVLMTSHAAKAGDAVQERDRAHQTGMRDGLQLALQLVETMR